MYSPETSLWIVYLHRLSGCGTVYPIAEIGTEVQRDQIIRPRLPSSDSSPLILALPLLNPPSLTHFQAHLPSPNSLSSRCLHSPCPLFLHLDHKGVSLFTCLHPLLLDEYTVCCSAIDDCISVGHPNQEKVVNRLAELFSCSFLSI